MLRFYKKAALLIEFDEGKHFALVNPNEIGGDISPQAPRWPLPSLITPAPRCPPQTR